MLTCQGWLSLSPFPLFKTLMNGQLLKWFYIFSESLETKANGMKEWSYLFMFFSLTSPHVKLHGKKPLVGMQKKTGLIDNNNNKVYYLFKIITYY